MDRCFGIRSNSASSSTVVVLDALPAPSQNRYNKTIQMEVNKFIGMLTNTLREDHSGWALEDYTHDAKRRFLAKFQKPFKHEMCYGVLKAALTKFAIDKNGRCSSACPACNFLLRRRQRTGA
ncbi:hypothetical protein MHU86_23338 [Fragilaria crotonensis]|nr:hypothetical protein MHU86_23338 [Fragilaria crotonensis]